MIGTGNRSEPKVATVVRSSPALTKYGPLFTKRMNISSQDLVKSRNREIRFYTFTIAPRRIAAKMPVEFQSDAITMTSDLSASSLHEILGQDVRPLSEQTWWRHQMKTFSTLLSLREGNSAVTSEFPSQKLVTRSFDISFDLRPDKRLNKPSRLRWSETQSCSLWCHCNEGHECFVSVWRKFAW